jgi:hypothetical protein
MAGLSSLVIGPITTRTNRDGRTTAGVPGVTSRVFDAFILPALGRVLPVPERVTQSVRHQPCRPYRTGVNRPAPAGPGDRVAA